MTGMQQRRIRQSGMLVVTQQRIVEARAAMRADLRARRKALAAAARAAARAAAPVRQHPAVTRLIVKNRTTYSRSGRTDSEWVRRWDERPDLWMALLRSLAGESLNGTANRRRDR